MRCIDVLWHHDYQDQPVRLISEIGADPQFVVRSIGATEFELAWRQATTGQSLLKD